MSQLTRSYLAAYVRNIQPGVTPYGAAKKAAQELGVTPMAVYVPLWRRGIIVPATSKKK